jgi:hypothetical protein
MSTTYSAPSGPARVLVNRAQWSVEARNSDRSSPGARRLVKVAPRGVSTSRCTRLWTFSETKTLPAKAAPRKSSR